MGVNNTELWNNLALCCFYAQQVSHMHSLDTHYSAHAHTVCTATFSHFFQYDMTLSCFERALALAEDDNMADVWYVTIGTS